MPAQPARVDLVEATLPLPFVDAYVHFIDPAMPGFRYPSLAPTATHPYLGADLERLKTRRFLAEDYVRESRNSMVAGFVHVEADAGANDPSEETRWVAGEAASTGLPHAMVGLVDLEDPQAEAVLERHLQSPGFSGVRHRSRTDFLNSRAFARGYALLQKHGLVFDLGTRPPGRMDSVRHLAERLPDVPLVLTHTGMILSFGRRAGPDDFEEWRAELRIASQADNVQLKVSGLTVIDHDWTVDSLRPWVLSAIEIFGPERCMFGSHWPYEALFNTHAALVAAYGEIITGFSADERRRLLSGNAARVYRIQGLH
jgi:predicted TIM-barrel fold metal-dependent hydrolase